MKRCLLSLLVILVCLFSWCNTSKAADPWNDGDMRALSASLGGWSVGNKVTSTGGVFVIDVSKGPIHVLNTYGVTTGTSIVFTGGASTFQGYGHVIIPGNGYSITALSGSGYNPIQYLSVGSTQGAWPFPTAVTTNAYRTYILDFVYGANSQNVSGSTIYAIAGVTIW